MKQPVKLLLSSGSPRRAELLTQVGVRFRICVTNVDEGRLDGEAPETHVRRLAWDKARAGLEICGPELPSLGADTVVLLNGEILGKPCDREEAVTMLKRLSGRTHQVLSAVALVMPDGHARDALNTTRVTFAPLPEPFIEWYCQTENPTDKAGAYAIQGAVGQYVLRIDGSYSGVMGLPLFESCALLRAAGVLP
ncbi:MAG TPA: Maf family protein [Xanthomonadales bacterium]|nr:Maf family protein [Xanthomonadales bacterium]